MLNLLNRHCCTCPQEGGTVTLINCTERANSNTEDTDFTDARYGAESKFLTASDHEKAHFIATSQAADGMVNVHDEHMPVRPLPGSEAPALSVDHFRMLEEYRRMIQESGPGAAPMAPAQAAGPGPAGAHYSAYSTTSKQVGQQQVRPHADAPADVSISPRHDDRSYDAGATSSAGRSPRGIQEGSAMAAPHPVNHPAYGMHGQTSNGYRHNAEDGHTLLQPDAAAAPNIRFAKEIADELLSAQPGPPNWQDRGKASASRSESTATPFSPPRGHAELSGWSHPSSVASSPPDTARETTREGSPYPAPSDVPGYRRPPGFGQPSIPEASSAQQQSNIQIPPDLEDMLYGEGTTPEERERFREEAKRNMEAILNGHATLRMPVAHHPADMRYQQEPDGTRSCMGGRFCS